VTTSRDPPGLLAALYGVYSLALFAVLGLGVLVLILPVPWLAARRRMVHCTARLWLWASGRRLKVHQGANMPGGACIVVANHTSYLDGIVLCAALPPRFGFVIKREMSRVPLANLLLRRIGSQYVDRGQGHKGARDTRKLLRKAHAGDALAFFPEGTFHRTPGLMPFRNGAFAVAARAQLPVVPVAIRGTRAALPPGSMMPRPGRIEVQIASPLAAPPPGDDRAVEIVKQAARDAILQRITEPDLAGDLERISRSRDTPA
jgi:1-acyl-sn-glycerol-3-phosphate acyltransferase